MPTRKVLFPCNDITLEGMLCLPDGDGPFPAVVVCHPHPQFGGNMDNNVVAAVCDALFDQEVVSLKFNFRGVGKSEGAFDKGIGEQEDVKAALSFLEKDKCIHASVLGLCGYSFGTMVAIPVADEDPRVQAFAGISSFFIRPGLLHDFRKPKFFIHGSDDEFLSTDRLSEIVSELPEPRICETVQGADHFWWGADNLAGEKVADFFASCLK